MRGRDRPYCLHAFGSPRSKADFADSGERYMFLFQCPDRIKHHGPKTFSARLGSLRFVFFFGFSPPIDLL